MATWRSAPATRSLNKATQSGMTPPAAKPETARRTSIASKLGAAAEASTSSAATPPQATIMRGLPMTSPSGPRIGWLSA